MSGPLGGPDDPYVALGDDARQAGEVAARSERRSRLERAGEVATWRGTLRDLAERRSRISVRLADGGVRRGSLTAVGADHLAVRTSAAQLLLILLDSVRTIRPEPGSPAPVATGDRDRVEGRRLVEVLAELVEERARILLRCDGMDEPLVGDLVGLGEDVLTFRVDGVDHGTVYLPLDAVTEVVAEP